MTNTVSDIMVDAIEQAGAQRVWGTVSDTINHFTDAVHHSSLRWMNVRQSQYDRPAIFKTTSPRCQASPGRGCRRRRTWAIRRPNLALLRRIVSYETSTPRSSIISSTSRRLKLNRA